MFNDDIRSQSFLAIKLLLKPSKPKRHSFRWQSHVLFIDLNYHNKIVISIHVRSPVPLFAQLKVIFTFGNCCKKKAKAPDSVIAQVDSLWCNNSEITPVMSQSNDDERKKHFLIAEANKLCKYCFKPLLSYVPLEIWVTCKTRKKSVESGEEETMEQKNF